jgi:hypothetical protein
MKPTAYFINTARGPIVDQKALTKVLQERKIAGAGLDVFEVEPTDPNDPILKLDNIIAGAARAVLDRPVLRRKRCSRRRRPCSTFRRARCRAASSIAPCWIKPGFKQKLERFSKRAG